MAVNINREGSALISLLLVLIVIGVLFWIFTKTQKKNEQQGRMMKEAGVNTSSYKSMIDSAKRIADDASKRNQ